VAERGSRHRMIAVDVAEAARVARPQMTIPWFTLAPLGALAVVAGGWLLMAGPAALGWLTSPNSQLSDALGLASRVLLLANGSVTVIGGQLVSIAPLGLSMVLMLLGIPVAGLAARSALDETADLRMLVLKTGGTYAGTYVVSITLIAFIVPETSVIRALLGSLLLGGLSGFWGAARAVGYDPGEQWPAGLRSLPRAVGVAALTGVGTGAALLTVVLVLGRDRIAGISDGLGGDFTAGILLIVMQLVWLPNLVIWAMAWALGAGVTLGEGTLLNMNGTSLGFLPSIPVLGAVPEPGPVPDLAWLWLLGGAVAGALAGLIVTLNRSSERFYETALAGGLAGIAAGVLLFLLAWFSSGGLGTQRLSHLGVGLGSLVITAPCILGLAGLVTGLMVGLARREWPTWRRADPEAGEKTTRQRRGSGSGAPGEN